MRPLTASDRLAYRALYIPKHESTRCILEHENGSTLYTYEQAGRFYVMAFWGTAGKPHIHECYRTEDGRAKRIQDWKGSVERSITMRAERKAENRKPHTFKVGDIVNTSWGYDQTNVDFFVITRVSAACVWVRPIKQDSESTGHMSGRCWPAMPIEPCGPETRHVANAAGFSIDGHGAHITTGDTYWSSYA